MGPMKYDNNEKLFTLTTMGPIGYWDQLVNGIKFILIEKSQITLSYLILLRSYFAYYYQSIIGISLSLSQSDPIN
jgi:hypothetical protein